VREKPVLFIDVFKKVFNENWEKLCLPPLELAIRDKIGIIAKPEISDVLSGVDKLFNHSDYKDEIRACRERYAYNFGRCSQAAADRIEAMLRG
jgi:YidC/Oxa1 family membrane protein insertase